MVNREKTENGLENPKYQETTSKPDIDKSLEKDRERFLEQLNQYWDDLIINYIKNPQNVSICL